MPQNPTPSTLLVTQLKAGNGIKLTPSGGTGVVTVAVDGGTENPASITGGANPFPITGQAPANATAAGGEVDLTGGAGGATSGAGGPAKVAGGAAAGGNSAGGPASVTGGAGHGSGAGGAATVTGGVGGATGAGGQADVTGGAAGSGSNGNGGDVVLTGGAKDGSGAPGNIVDRSLRLVHQGAAAAKTVSATLTAAEVLAGIITVNQGAAGASAQQLPLATDLDAALPASLANDAFDFSVINISTVSAESASLTTNTGWTLVGDMDVSANSGATTKSAGRFRARKTATGLWTLYRLS